MTILRVFGIAVLLLALAGSASAGVLVAASGTDGTGAQFVCDGVEDQQEINAALQAAGPGGTVTLSPGVFHTVWAIKPLSGQTLEGAGESTILDMAGDYDARIAVDQPYTTVRGLTVTNRGWLMITTSHVRVHDVTIRDSKKTAPTVNGMFFVWAKDRVCEDIEFIRCTAQDVGSTGFNLNGMGFPRENRNIRFDGCRAIRCGNAGSGKEWAVGFDFHEGADLYDLQVLNCYAEDNWETGFYFEPNFQNPDDYNQEVPVQVNSYVSGCTAVGNGWRNTDPGRFYMSGFYLSEGVVVENCIAVNNLKNGFWVWQCARDVVIRNCIDMGSDYSFQVRSGQNIRLENCWSQEPRTYALYTWGSNGNSVDLNVVEPARETDYLSVGKRLDHQNEEWGCYNMQIAVDVDGATTNAADALEYNEGSGNSITLRSADLASVAPNVTVPAALASASPTTTVWVTPTTTVPTTVVTPTWESYRYQLEVPSDGVYSIQLTVSSPVTGTTLALSVDDGVDFVVNVPKTGSHAATSTVTANANLGIGKHILDIQADGDARVSGMKLMAVPTYTTTPTPTIWSTPTPEVVTPVPTPTATATPTPTPTLAWTPTPVPTPTETPWWYGLPTNGITPTPFPTPTPVTTGTIDPNVTYPWVVPTQTNITGNVTVETPPPTENPTTIPTTEPTATWTGKEVTPASTYDPWVTVAPPTAATVAVVTTKNVAVANTTANQTANVTVVRTQPPQQQPKAGAPLDITLIGLIAAILIIGGVGFLLYLTKQEEPPEQMPGME